MENEIIYAVVQFVMYEGYSLPEKCFVNKNEAEIFAKKLQANDKINSEYRVYEFILE